MGSVVLGGGGFLVGVVEAGLLHYAEGVLVGAEIGGAGGESGGGWGGGVRGSWRGGFVGVRVSRGFLTFPLDYGEELWNGDRANESSAYSAGRYYCVRERGL